MSQHPALIACGHGTRSPEGQAVMSAWVRALADARPELDVLPAFVDVQEPTLADVAGGCVERGRRAVVVPLLLSTGYHVQVDVERVVAASSGLLVAAPALGPDRLLVDLLQQRLAEAGAGPEDGIVLAAAGSSDPRAVGDVEAVGEWLGRERGVEVVCGYLAAARPTVEEAVARLKEHRPGEPVSVANYLLAPGHFATRLARLAEDGTVGRVAATLAPAPSLTRLVLRRFDQVAATFVP
ncbi:sirohydrochlorin chelatase [Spongisporangium articulatum]|uniref:Sirohydrochlorin chelatase n=1 Tax=Spongisporangium articulatum TaxID=3362603 RepID=A0ABW8AP91_9ACTN